VCAAHLGLAEDAPAQLEDEDGEVHDVAEEDDAVAGLLVGSSMEAFPSNLHGGKGTS
jgi:hypothetical protein